MYRLISPYRIPIMASGLDAPPPLCSCRWLITQSLTIDKVSQHCPPQRKVEIAVIFRRPSTQSIIPLFSASFMRTPWMTTSSAGSALLCVDERHHAFITVRSVLHCHYPPWRSTGLLSIFNTVQCMYS